MKLKDIVLSIDQLEILKKLGLVIKDSVFSIIPRKEEPKELCVPTEYVRPEDDNIKVLTLTFQEIIEILPKELDNSLYFSLGQNKIVYVSKYGSGGNDYTFEGENLLDAAYNTLIWMLEYEKI